MTYDCFTFFNEPGLLESMNPIITLFSVVRDIELYNACIRGNVFCRGADLQFIDNNAENKAIPKRYNDFINSFDFSKPAWMIFCHEDFEFREPLAPLLENLPRDALYGPIGCARKGVFPFRHQVFLGQIEEMNRDGSGKPWTVGRHVAPLMKTETFDCCCLIVHSSLIKKYNLRFDEELPFDLYVEDFCATAKVKHGIRSRILPFKATHHSGSKASDRLYRHLPYLREKYPRNCFCASCTYFGTPSPSMRFERWLAKLMGF